MQVSIKPETVAKARLLVTKVIMSDWPRQAIVALCGGRRQVGPLSGRLQMAAVCVHVLLSVWCLLTNSWSWSDGPAVLHVTTQLSTDDMSTVVLPPSGQEVRLL